MTANLLTHNLLEDYQHTRYLSQQICEPLQPEDQVVQPVPFVSPPKWHLAHTTWFFETFILKEYVPDYTLFHPQYPYLFNSYYEQAGDRWLRSQRGFLSRPTVAEILKYRAYVDQAMGQLLAAIETATTPSAATIRMITTLGIHHEQQHQELLFYDLKYILGHNPLFPAYLPAISHSQDLEINEEIKPEIQKNQARVTQSSLTQALPTLTYLDVAEGLYEIGHTGDEFCFDNERSRHCVFLNAYQILDRLVTCGEYLQFIEAGGYQQSQYWLMEGWEWVQQEKIIAPMYWHQDDQGVWQHYTFSGLEPVNLHAPIMHISYYEADAFARWSGQRLPTEFEWEVACQKFEPTIPDRANLLTQISVQKLRPLPQSPQVEIAEDSLNLHSKNQQITQPVTQQKQQLKKQPETQPETQFYGNVWEWTSSAYSPYPNYEILPGALGEYNGKFMVNQMVLRGGSFATDRRHIRSTYRNFFHPQMRWQFAGLRLVKDVS